ncbi:MAG: hypothetical protein JNM98_21155 [Rhodocyclaceae bacterium]|nr:hypothetical protein [Rhodocyclaceae bacterium]
MAAGTADFASAAWRRLAMVYSACLPPGLALRALSGFAGSLRRFRYGVLAALFALYVAACPAADHLAPGFSMLPAGAKVVLMPVDVELMSVSAGGVFEPRADWTAAAAGHLTQALLARGRAAKVEAAVVAAEDMDEFEEISALHAAVAQAISLHHFGNLKLPTKGGKLDWSLGDAIAPVRERTGADYALFTWVRDSYASGERKAAMVFMALLGVGLVGGFQVGYASLVDLHSGQIVWFNSLFRMSGDLREAAPAAESVDTLLTEFPRAP